MGTIHKSFMGELAKVPRLILLKLITEKLAAQGLGDHTGPADALADHRLKGDGDTVPWIAGRSPSFIVRQLFDIQNGKRTGTADPMKMVVEKLTADDIVAIAAYVASLKP